jgi:hypothetical protein
MVSKPINPFHWSFLQVLGLVTLMSFDLIEWKFCFISMNEVNQARFYTRPNVMEITFYHWTHTQANRDPIHSACDPGSTS